LSIKRTEDFNGFGFVFSFGLAGYVVPDELVYGIAYNTNTWGANPIGTNGPFESLNVGVTPHPAAGVGTGVLASSGALPGTGSNSSNGMLIALAIITAGAAITLVARRRNDA
jgi:LPXTG-motif cell wall-anchored protein